SSYRIKLSANLKSWGIHNVFHTSKLWIHEPNDNRLFPGRMDSQVILTDESTKLEPEWAVEHILSHKGKGTNTVFELEWCLG
ncbi:hypothetical protein NEOLEDRAFT_1025251, partial [Neolentinus lepideus HHB14362 ss-1]